MKTAVEWLTEKLTLSDQDYYKEDIKQAKKLEKKHIIDAYRNGKMNKFENSEIYYNETFKKQ